ncbi:MAG: cysteine synthase A [Elusimicrobiales bacterium]
MKYAQDMRALIGRTPLVKINRLAPGPALLLAKLEYFNPSSSVKDRAAYGMLADAETRGLLRPGSLVVEPTSGNTGIGLAWLCSLGGYRLVLTMPETMSLERRRIMNAFGAKIVLTPGAAGMAGAVAKAEEIFAATPGAYMPRQFANPANPAIHEKTTAEEIWADTDGYVDAVVAGVGTGGTITGIARGLKKRKPGVQIIAVEPSASALLSGGKAGPHRIQGIGSNFIPENLDRSLIDAVMAVGDDEAGVMARRLMKEEGILAGISSGAAMRAAVTLAASPEYAGKTIVAVLPDTAERYLSTWLFEDIPPVGQADV